MRGKHAKKMFSDLACLSNGNMFAEVKTAAQLCAEREEDILRLGAEHAKPCHSKEMLPPDMTARVNTAIKTVTANV